MGAQVDELVEQIRVEADAHLTRGNPGVKNANGNAAVELDHLRANLAIARRAQDRLPPVTSNRHGRIARFELWIKQGLKRATRWFTWEQTNFNAATSASLANIAAILSQMEKSLANLRAAVGQSENVADGATSAEIDTRLGHIERQLREVVKIIQTDESTQLLREEQRVSFRQLELQINEATVISDRVKRNFQVQLDRLARRLDEIEKTHAEPQSD
jgi:hypothetical protein